MTARFSIRRATEEDCAALGVIAPAAYAAAYDWLWDDLAAFVSQLRSFDAGVFADQLADPAFDIWVAETGDAPIGFLTLKFPSDEPVAKAPGGAEIPRIYFLPQATGMGLARKLYDAAEKAAREKGARYLWLDAMASAEWAQRTYERWGFSSVGRTRFPKNVKEGEADMIVMTKPLDF